MGFCFEADKQRIPLTKQWTDFDMCVQNVWSGYVTLGHEIFIFFFNFQISNTDTPRISNTDTHEKCDLK